MAMNEKITERFKAVLDLQTNLRLATVPAMDSLVRELRGIWKEETGADLLPDDIIAQVVQWFKKYWSDCDNVQPEYEPNTEDMAAAVWRIFHKATMDRQTPPAARAMAITKGRIIDYLKSWCNNMMAPDYWPQDVDIAAAAENILNLVDFEVSRHGNELAAGLPPGPEVGQVYKPDDSDNWTAAGAGDPCELLEKILGYGTWYSSALEINTHEKDSAGVLKNGEALESEIIEFLTAAGRLPGMITRQGAADRMGYGEDHVERVDQATAADIAHLAPLVRDIGWIDASSINMAARISRGLRMGPFNVSAHVKAEPVDHITVSIIVSNESGGSEWHETKPGWSIEKGQERAAEILAEMAAGIVTTGAGHDLHINGRPMKSGYLAVAMEEIKPWATKLIKSAMQEAGQACVDQAAGLRIESGERHLVYQLKWMEIENPDGAGKPKVMATEKLEFGPAKIRFEIRRNGLDLCLCSWLEYGGREIFYADPIGRKEYAEAFEAAQGVLTSLANGLLADGHAETWNTSPVNPLNEHRPDVKEAAADYLIDWFNQLHKQKKKADRLTRLDGEVFMALQNVAFILGLDVPDKPVAAGRAIDFDEPAAPAAPTVRDLEWEQKGKAYHSNQIDFGPFCLNFTVAGENGHKIGLWSTVWRAGESERLKAFDMVRGTYESGFERAQEIVSELARNVAFMNTISLGARTLPDFQPAYHVDASRIPIRMGGELIEIPPKPGAETVRRDRLDRFIAGAITGLVGNPDVYNDSWMGDESRMRQIGKYATEIAAVAFENCEHNYVNPRPAGQVVGSGYVILTKDGKPWGGRLEPFSTSPLGWDDWATDYEPLGAQAVRVNVLAVQQ